MERGKTDSRTELSGYLCRKPVRAILSYRISYGEMQLQCQHLQPGGGIDSPVFRNLELLVAANDIPSVQVPFCQTPFAVFVHRGFGRRRDNRPDRMFLL